MKNKINKLIQFKQWFSFFKYKHYSITPIQNNMMLKNNEEYLKCYYEIMNKK
jgi:hypothetical protein